NELDRDNLSNYRPITLTNTDYKILTKALSIRFQNVIKTIISEDQAGFIKGRNITSHIRLIDDITSHLRKQNAPGALLALDFSKAFDSLRKECIIEALEIFNVGPHFIHLVSTVMNNTESCIHNGGWLSDWFPTEKGIRQGCPLSPLLFVTAVEILAIKIRNNKEINGIQIGVSSTNTESTATTKIKQFADDTTLTLKDEKDIKLTLETVENFEKYSGLKLNKGKSTGTWLGSKQEQSGNESGIPMKKGKIKILGIYFSANKEASLIEDNWNDKIENTLRMINSWGKRNPTLYGKAILAKTLMLSQFSYALQALAYPETTLKKINTMIYRFLWKRKYNNKKAFEKIKRNVLSLPIAEGGLNMINIEHQQNMFLAKWASRLSKTNEATWAITAKAQFTSLGGPTVALNANVPPKELKGIETITSHFWKQVLKTVTSMNQNREVRQ
ncbi:reverse transcriptase domain-containing protein, partial [Thiolapillus sp.]|uniref:RNA-directed DNA polymerase n=1 Tax=Thiolapillus sp. TaxID=2017437 RepID=UPI003AF54594